MDRYHLWFDLRPGAKDLELADAITAFLGYLERAGKIGAWILERRKLGLGPTHLPEWHVHIEVADMAQLEAAFAAITPRTGEEERLHAGVWSRVANLQTGLWRDFPDANRARQPRNSPSKKSSPAR